MLPKEERAERKLAMEAMRKNGATLTEIGNAFGLKRQRIYQIIGRAGVKRFREVTPDKCAYVGIREWMNYNKVGFADFTRMIYGDFHPENYQRVCNWLKGNGDPRKKDIDKILQIIKQPYEVAFGKEG